MSIPFQLYEIFTVIHAFDWSRAQKYGLLWGKQQYLPLWSYLSEEWPQNTGRVLFEVFSNSAAYRTDQKLRREMKAKTKDVKRLNWRNGKDAFWRWTCHVCLVMCKQPFHEETPLGLCRVDSCFVLVHILSVTSFLTKIKTIAYHGGGIPFRSGATLLQERQTKFLGSYGDLFVELIQSEPVGQPTNTEDAGQPTNTMIVDYFSPLSTSRPGRVKVWDLLRVLGSRSYVIKMGFHCSRKKEQKADVAQENDRGI